MATVLSPPEQKVILQYVSWETYVRLLADHKDRSSPRFTYDHGMLEIMSPSTEHERLNRRLATIVEIVAEELHSEFDNVGSTTFTRADLLRGFEPDSCFYLQNVERILDKAQIDLETDPPPDLIIEIDITHPSLDKFPIYAQVGVGEIWRYDGSRFAIFRLEQARYVEQHTSTVLPGLTGAAIADFLEASKRLKRTVWVQHVREWVRGQGAAGNEVH